MKTLPVPELKGAEYRYPNPILKTATSHKWLAGAKMQYGHAIYVVPDLSVVPGSFTVKPGGE